MKYKKKHIFSFLLIILLIIFTVATQCVSAGQIIHYNRDLMTCEIADQYLLIKINRMNDPNNYNVDSYGIELTFQNTMQWSAIQGFDNFINDNGENMSEYGIIEWDRGVRKEEIFKCSEFVFETYMEDNKYVIKIKKEIIKFNVIRMVRVELLYQYKDMERYEWQGQLRLTGL
jgi:hypothetical protein